jgi:hypothetical protein
MSFSRLFKRNKKSGVEEGQDSSIGQGIHYVYLIIVMQIAFLFGVLAVIMIIGKVLATPMWVFLATMILGVAGCVYIYRKARQQFQKFSENFRRVNLSERNYEISFMGGMLTMRVEQSSQKLLQAPVASPVIDAEAVETPVVR